MCDEKKERLREVCELAIASYLSEALYKIEELEKIVQLSGCCAACGACSVCGGSACNDEKQHNTDCLLEKALKEKNNGS